MPETLTNRERAALKARAHSLEPIVHVGHAGVSDSVAAEIDRSLTAHELIKVKIAGDDRDVRVQTGEAICSQMDAVLVQRVGKVIVLWRPTPDETPD